MNKLDLIRQALKNFMRRKTRSILTILGVIIGTAAIVVMISIGIGQTENYRRQLSSMGSLNIINVNNWYFPPPDATGRSEGRQTVLDDKVVAKIAAIEGVEAVTPMLETYLKIVSGKLVTGAQVVGIDPKTLESFDFKTASGRLLTEDDTAELLFGSQTPYNFYNPRASGRGGGAVMIGGWGMGGSTAEKPKPPVDVLYDKLILTFDYSYGEKKSPVIIPNPDEKPNKPPKLYKTKGVGILEDSQDEKAWSIYINIAYLKKLIKENAKSQGSSGYRAPQEEGYQRLKVKVGNIDDVQKVQKQIQDMGYGADSLGDILKNLQAQSATMQIVLGGIGAISLLVAALGITNTMIMSMYERTREIGVMKVLGCMLGDIRSMFLFEAGLIGLVGGLIGLLFSYGASFLLNKYAAGMLGGGGWGGAESIISLIPLWLALAALGFATLVGLVSGFMPARRAMKLSALEAIRTE